MSARLRPFLRAYALLLRLYPAPFRAEYADEMQGVFAEALAEATRQGPAAVVGLCLRELCEFPAAAAREHRAGFNAPWNEKMKMTSLPLTPRAEIELPATREEVLAGLAPFVLVGVVLSVYELGQYLAAPPISTAGAIGMAAGWLALLAGLGWGWVRGFPRWVYPYVGSALFISALAMESSMPSWPTLGAQAGLRELLGWRAWVPLALVAVVALLRTRSLRPLARFGRGVWRDWTRLTFLGFGVLPVFAWLFTDETYGVFPLVYVLLCGSVLTLGAYFYMRGRGPGQRAFSLLGALAGFLLISTGLSAVYWDGRVEPWMGGTAYYHWYDMVNRGLTSLPLYAAVFFSPALLGLLRRWLSRPGAAA